MIIARAPRRRLGVTVQEAMAAGVAVIAPDRGGPLDLVSHSVDGVLYDADRPTEIRRAADGLTADPARRRRVASAAHRSVADRTWTAVGDQLLAYYARVRDHDVAVPSRDLVTV